MQPDERDAAYLWDMLDAARTIIKLTAEMSLPAYEEDRRTQLATERALEIVGEAAGKVSKTFREQHPEIPWRQIIGQRNVLIHEYGQVRNDRIWRVVKESIPQLIDMLKPMVD